MANKHEWRRHEKAVYIPGAEPTVVDVPAFKFLTVDGEGSPDEPCFSDCVEALYALAYPIKMTLKRLDKTPANYIDYTVYPLEGVWDINEEARKRFTGIVNKDDFVYQLMIRQPDFISEAMVEAALEMAMKKKPNPKLEQVRFQSIAEGKCVQMLHVGRFEDEPASFEKMEAFAANEGLTRLSKVHREIYLSDSRRVAPDKLRTVLRFRVQESVQ